MKKLLIVLAIVSANAVADDTKFVDMALFDTTIRNVIGESQFTNKGCTVVQYGPEEDMVYSNTFPRKRCEELKEVIMDTMKKNGVGIFSMSINGVEVMKSAKP